MRDERLPESDRKGKEVLNILLKGTSPLILVLSPVSQSIRMETPLPSAWRRLFHPHRLTHPFRVVPGIYGVALFAFFFG